MTGLAVTVTMVAAFAAADLIDAVTASALAVIRASHLKRHGPDADPYGLRKLFAIDLFGNAVHVAAAAVMWAWGRFKPRSAV